MKAFMQNPRTGLPALAVFVTLVLSFAIPPFNSVVAAGSSSSMSSASSSPMFNCDSTFSVANTVAPGDIVRGTLVLSNGCQFEQRKLVNVELNGQNLQKLPDASGGVPVSVKTNADGATGVLDDPVDVTLNTGRNDIFVTGPAVDPNGSFVRNATIDAFFNLAAPVVVTAPTTIVVTPVTLQTTTGSTGGGSLAHTGMNLFALFLLALMAIALGTYTVASERSMPLFAGAGAMAPAVSVPLFDPPLGVPETWTLEVVVLTAVSYILGPPPGRHVRKGPRGLVPALRDWLERY